jgi:hypothetical protein
LRASFNVKTITLRNVIREAKTASNDVLGAQASPSMGRIDVGDTTIVDVLLAFFGLDSCYGPANPALGWMRDCFPSLFTIRKHMHVLAHGVQGLEV